MTSTDTVVRDFITTRDNFDLHRYCLSKGLGCLVRLIRAENFPIQPVLIEMEPQIWLE